MIHSAPARSQVQNTHTHIESYSGTCCHAPYLSSTSDESLWPYVNLTSLSVAQLTSLVAAGGDKSNTAIAIHLPAEAIATPQSKLTAWHEL